MKLMIVNTSYYNVLSRLLVCSLVALFGACEGGDDPVMVGPVITPGGMVTAGDMAGSPAGEAPAGEDPAGEGPAGDSSAGDEPAGVDPAGAPAGDPAGVEPPPCMPTEVGPDEAVFASTVGPSLITTCAGAFCHGPDTANGIIFPVSNLDFSPPLEGDLLAQSIEVSMSYVLPGEPSGSLLLQKAYNAHISNGPFFQPDSLEYTQLSDWIEAMIECVPVDPPPPVGGMDVGGEPAGEMAGEVAGEPAGTPGGGDTVVFCDLLPNGDPQNRADGLYYQTFEEDINNKLTMGCGSSGCHGTPMNGFWLQASADPCAIPANFLMTQAYINFAEPDESLILTAPYDPEHSGHDVYTGRSDPRFVALRNWVLLAFQ